MFHVFLFDVPVKLIVLAFFFFFRWYSNGLNMRPNPFECRISSRNTEIHATIEREGRQALQDLSQYDGTTEYRMSTYYAEENL